MARFSDNSIERLRRTVRKSEAEGPERIREHRNPERDSRPVLMVVKESFSEYLRCRRLRSGGEEAEDVFVAKPEKLRGFSNNYLVDDEVWVVRGGYTGITDGAGDPVSHIHVGRYELAAFGVKLSQTGGSAGDGSSQCSFTYTVTDMNDNQLATGVDPTAAPHLCNRPTAGFRIAARSGVATMESGVLVLVSFNEIDDAEGCTT